MSLPNARPWKMVLPLASVLTLLVIWSIYWSVAQTVAHREFELQRQQLQGAGHPLTCSSEKWGGYPFRFEFTCDAPHVDVSSSASVSAAKLQAVALAYRPWQILALLDGPTTVAVPTQAPITISHDRALASLTLSSGKGGSATAEVSNVQATGIAKANRLVVSIRTEDQSQLDAAIEGAGLDITTEIGTHIVIETLTGQGTFTGDHVFVLKAVQAKQGDLALSASGQISLDAQRQLTGQIVVTANDAAKLVAAVGDAMNLNEQAHTALGAMIQLSGNQITFTAGDGQLFAGPVKIADLDPL